MHTPIPTILFWASGSKTDGGSGFKKCLERSRGHSLHPILNARIVGVVSQHKNGGVHGIAEEFGVPFSHYHKEEDPLRQCTEIQEQAGAQFHMLSGFTLPLPVKNLRDPKSLGLDPRYSVNIHPALLSIKRADGTPRFGGKGMHGIHAHTEVFNACHNGELGNEPHSGFTMHFLDYRKDDEDPYDKGPIIKEVRVRINSFMTPTEIGKAVNVAEHKHQAFILNAVVHGLVSWDGINHASLAWARP